MTSKEWWTKERRERHSKYLIGRKLPKRKLSSSKKTAISKFGFSWLDRKFGTEKELQAFKGCHNRVREGKSPSIHWERNLDGFYGWLEEIGRMPKNMNKPSVGRKNHSLGYIPGNIQWEEYSVNSIKRRGTKYVAN